MFLRFWFGTINKISNICVTSSFQNKARGLGQVVKFTIQSQCLIVGICYIAIHKYESLMPENNVYINWCHIILAMK